MGDVCSQLPHHDTFKAEAPDATREGEDGRVDTEGLQVHGGGGGDGDGDGDGDGPADWDTNGSSSCNARMLLECRLQNVDRACVWLSTTPERRVRASALCGTIKEFLDAELGPSWPSHYVLRHRYPAYNPMSADMNWFRYLEPGVPGFTAELHIRVDTRRR